MPRRNTRRNVARFQPAQKGKGRKRSKAAPVVGDHAPLPDLRTGVDPTLGTPTRLGRGAVRHRGESL